MSNVLLKDVGSLRKLQFVRKKPTYWIKLVCKILPFVWLDGWNSRDALRDFIQNILG